MLTFNFGTIITASNHWLLYDCANVVFKYRIIVNKTMGRIFVGACINGTPMKV